MPRKVIGAGLGRTGTLSLKVALEELGFSRCYHMIEVFKHPEHLPVWDAAARGEPTDWEILFKGYQATVDWPGCNFFEEYARLYPEAKVILTVRDAERWYASATQTIYYVTSAFPGWMRLVLPRMRRFSRMAHLLIWDGMFQGRFEDKPFALEIYHGHNAHVRRVIPPERLLVFDVHEGWKPLCEFLEVPIPEGKPFPRLNDAEEFRSRIRRGARAAWAVSYALLALLVLLTAWLALRWFS
jgi:hypothetical protein